jgi:hypothetical protein
VSGTGTLTFIPGAATLGRAFLTFLDRDGNAERLPIEPRGMYLPRLSPDGSRVAFAVGTTPNSADSDIWTWDIERRTLARTTFTGGLYPVWSPDGSKITFTRGSQPDGLFETSALGARGEELIVDFTPSPLVAGDWSPDGRTLVYSTLGRRSDLYLLTRGEEPRLFEEGASIPQFSPDGRWLLYQSPAAGRTTVYVRPVEGPGKWQVSTSFGGYPQWSANGSEILYLDITSLDRSLMVVDVLPGETFSAGPPRVLIQELGYRYTTATAPQMNWSASRDGQRFVFVEVDRDDGDRASVEVLIDWAATLPPID